MKVRFAERFELEIDAQPGIGSLLVLRMILQPIVENSILHGFGGAAGGRMARPRRGTIRVVARREERALPPPASPEPWAAPIAGQVLVIEVRDDGAGMSPERAPRAAATGPPAAIACTASASTTSSGASCSTSARRMDSRSRASPAPSPW